jgi:TolB-like protein/Flp pilus assembly protein TadD
VQVAERELALHPDELSALYWKAWALARLGELETARTLCALIQQRSQGDQPVFLRGTHLSALLATAGLVDAALQDLRTYRTAFTDGYVITRAVLELDPAFDPLRADPRFQEIVQAAPAPAEATAKPGEKSVAVLPFVNQSADKDNEYFSDGIAEELLTVLQKIPGLRVAARTSAWSFKGKNPTAQEVGEKLGAAHVVEGSVQKFGNKVKITARLSRAATNVAVWSKSFGPLEPTDLFATQSELAAAIATELRGRLTGDSTGVAATEMVALVQAAQKGGTKNAEAHELYLRGKFLANQFSLESFARAEALLQQAVERDSNFALAWALLAQVGRLRSGWGNTRPEVEAGYALSERASGRAVELAPDLPEAHLARVNFQLIAFDWKGARASVRRLLELAPTTALESEMRLATALGERDRAVAAGRKAVAADPVNPELRVNFAFALVNARRLEDAEAEFRRAVEMSVASPVGYAGIALVKLLQGKAGEAAAAANRESSGWARTQAIALARWGEGDRAGAEAALAELSEREGDVAAYQVAQVYGFRGDADNAFRWLERALRQRDPGLSFCGSEILFESLHADPRWPAFLRKIGLHDEQLQELR